MLLNLTDSPQVNAEHCRLYNAVSKRLRDGLAKHLISLCRTYVLQMRRNELKYGFYLRGKGAGGTPLFRLYRYVRRQRVCFF